MANVLVKPRSDSDGNLVILADNTQRMHLVDVTTGEVIEEGRNSGASNGREATFRFGSPGSRYRNVGLMDERGNVILTLESAGDRVQFNYTDYEGLVRTPVSTIEGYRWDNTRNIESTAQGGPSNSDIANMSSEEYIQWLESQRESSGEEGGASGGATSGMAIAAPIVADAISGAIDGGVSSVGDVVGSFGGEAGVLLSDGSIIAQGAAVPEGLTAVGSAATESSGILGAASDVAPYVGAAIQAYNIGNLWSSDDDGFVSDEQKIAETAKRVGLAVADMYTFGLASVADAAFGDEIDSVMQKINPVWGALNRKTGKMIMAERIQDLQEQGVEDPFAQRRLDDYGASFEELVDRETQLFEASGGQLGNPTFAESRDKRDLRFTDTVGSLANLEVFGQDYWEKFNDRERNEINKRGLEEGLYDERRGQVFTNNEERLKEIGDEVLKDRGKGLFPETPVVPEAFSAQSQQEDPLENPQPVQRTRAMVASDDEPPITDFMQTDGAHLSPPADNGALALSLIQSAPSQIASQGLLAEAFADPRRRERQSQAGFSQLQGAFQ